MMLRNTEEKDIKLFVSCHKPSFVPENGVFCPIQVGTALADKKLEGMKYYDNQGEHISEKNRQYCELTAQYFAWKNIEADYYGFFHYRRYLNLSPIEREEDGWGNVVYHHITEEVLEENYLDTKENIQAMIQGYDIIVPIGRAFNREESSNTVYEQFIKEHPTLKEDIDKAIRILSKKYPDFTEACSTYLNSKLAYECNMFIMKKELFFKYCTWLFSICSELEKQLDLTEYNMDENRVVGYIAERLFGIYFTKIKLDQIYKFREVQKIYFFHTDPTEEILPVFKDAVPIILSANNEFVPYLAVFIQSVAENSSKQNRYDLVVLHRDITEKNRKILKIMLKEYENFSLRFFDMEEIVQGLSLFVDQHLSVETYYRLAIQEIMAEYKKVLYLDCDMVMLTDAAKLYQIDVEGTYLAAVLDVDLAGTIKRDKDRRTYVEQVLKLKDPYRYFQAGVLVLNLDMFRKNFTVKQLFQVAASYQWRQHDQDVLNYLCKENFILLKNEWNVIMNWEEGERSRIKIIAEAPMQIYQDYLKSRKNPFIVHYAGYQKPWNVPTCDYAEWFWKYAKNTPYYQQLLKRVMQSGSERISVPQESSASAVHNELESIVQQVDNQGIRIRGVDEVVYVDGAMVKLINWFNRKYPIHSKKRARLRTILRKVLK